MPLSKTGPRRLRAAELRSKVLSMRRAGHRYSDVAVACGCSRSTCYAIVSKELTKLARMTHDDAAWLRQQEIERLDSLMAAIWKDAIKGNLRAVDRCISLINHRAKLLGLYAPEKTETRHTFNAETEEQLIQEARRRGIIKDEYEPLALAAAE
jgi:hypothetical protein